MVCQELEIAVPGSYDPNQPIVRIQRVQSSIQVSVGIVYSSISLCGYDVGCFTNVLLIVILPIILYMFMTTGFFKATGISN